MFKSRFASFWLVCVAVLAVPIHAATLTSVVSGNWNTASTWSPQQIPTSSDDVVIVGGTGVSIPTGYAAFAKSLTIQGDIVSPASLDLDASGASLTITNGVTMTAPGGSVVDQVIVGQGALACGGNISIDAGVSGGISRVVVSSGSVTANSISFAGTSTSTEVKYVGNGSLVLSGDLGTGGTFSASTGAVEFNGSGAQSVGPYAYYTLDINKSSGTATLAGPISVGTTGVGGNLIILGGRLDDNGNQITGNGTGSLSIANGAELDLGSGAGSTLMPSFSSYSFASGSTVEYKGQAAGTIASTPTYGNLTIDTATATASMSGNTTVAGNVTIVTGTLDLGSFTHNVGGNWTNSGSVNASTSTVNFNSASTSQAISRGTSAFNNITFSGAGTKTITGNGLFVNGNVVINSGSNCDFGALLHQIAGSWTNNGTFAGTGSTVDFNSASGPQSIGSSGFFNLTFTGASTKTATGALTIANSVVINSGSNFNPAGFTHNVGGSWTASGTFTPGSSTINFNGGSAQNIGATTFNNVTFSNAGTKTFTGNVAVNGSLTVNSGATLNGGTGSHTIAGNFTVAGTVVNSSNSWTFNGGSAQSIGGAGGAQFANLTLSNASGITLTGSTLVNGTLALGSTLVTTGANVMIVGAAGSVTRSSGYVIGELKKKSATSAVTFDVGTAAGYSPVAMVITGTTDLGVAAVGGNSCCFFAGSNHLNHYWQFLPSSPVTANLTFTWPVAEVTGTEANYILANYASSWTYAGGTINTGAHTATLNSASLPASLVSWIVGEAASLAGTPVIAGFTPTSGPVGTSVVISGSALTGATAVAFNGTNASTYSVDNDGQITATVPVGATTGPVSVTSPGGTASNGTFTVSPAPTIASFSPTAGSIGVTVVITGSAFTGATSVTFNGTSASYTVNSDTQITATVPSGATTGQLVVVTPSGSGTSVGTFTVNAPGPIQSAASGNWSSPSTWFNNVPPGTFDSVEILNGHTVTLTAGATCAGLAVDSGATLNLGSNTLTDSASASFFGTVSGSGTLLFSGNGNDSIDGIATLAPPVAFQGDRTFAGSAALSFSSGFSITTGATVTNNGQVHVDNTNGITGTGAFVQGTNAVVTNSGPFLPSGSLTASASPNLIDYNGAAQTVKATTYHNLILSGSGTKDITGLSTINGSFTLNGSASATATTGLTIGGDVTLQSGTSFNLATFSHSVAGNWTNNGGSVTQSSSTVTFNGSTAQTIARGTQGFNNVVFSGAGAKSVSGAGLFVTGDVTINSGATFNGGALAHQVTGNWTNSGTFNPGTSTVEFQGATSSTVGGDFSTVIINKSGAATVTIGVDIDATSTTQLSAGTLVIGAKNLITGSITGSGAITMTTGKIFLTGNSNAWSGTFTPGSGTVEINGTSAQSIRGGTYNNVKINKATGTATMANALTVNGLLYIASGTLADNGFQMVAGGSATLQIDNAGTLKLGSGVSATTLPSFTTSTLATSSTVTYGAGSSSQQINSTPSYGHLVVDSGSGSGITKTLTGSTLNAASLDVTNTGGTVTLDLQGKTANISGNVGGNGAISFATTTGNLNISGNFASTGTFTAGLSTVTFNGSGAQSIRATTYDNVVIANSGTATLAGTTTANGTFTVNPGGSFSMGTAFLRIFGSGSNSGTFDAGSNTLDLRGDFANNGTFVGTSGTVGFNGSTTQNWNGSFATTLNDVSVANAAGVNINNSITAGGTFTLNGGNVTIAGGQQVAIGSTGLVTRSNGSYFIGKLQMFVPAATLVTFHLGTASGYAPVDVTPAAGGPFTITSVSGAQPNRTGVNTLSRYWTIAAAATPSADMQFSWNAADVAGSEAIYTAGRYSGGWTRPPTTINTTNHTATVTGITTYAGDWTAGEPLSLGGSATCTTIPSGAISWWRGEGNAVDDKGTNNGTLTGGATTAGGKVLQGFLLNGSSAYVTVPDSATLHPSNFSIEGWFKVAGGAGTTRMIVSKRVGGGVEDSFIVYVANDDTIAAAVGDSVSTDILATTVTVTASTWHHFAYTYDGTTQALYLDGVLANAGTTAKTAGYDSGAFLIGADNDNGSITNFFNGSIDEVTLYGSVLTATQIANIYGADSAGKCFSAPAPNITSFNPTSGLAGTTVTITGSGLTGASTVAFNGTASSYTVDSDTQITATVPGGATTGPIAVTTAGGTFTTPGNFTVFSGTADLAISISAPLTSTVNLPFNYTISVNNLGPAAGSGVTVTSTLPANLTYNGHTTAAPWSCLFTSPTLSCTATTLPTGGQPNIVVNVTPTATGSVGESATIASTGTFDNNGANDSASTSTTINAASADLAVTHNAAPASVANGGTIIWTIVTTNNGPSNATNVSVTEVLPANVSYVGATGATCNNVSGTVTCTAGGLSSGGSNTITITTTATAVGTAAASASATATESDPNAADNTSIAASSAVTGSSVIVTNTNDSGPNSLRQAILDANGAVCTAPCNIQFAIGSGAQFISLFSGLPAVTVPVVIDGTTQPGYSGAPLITIDVFNDTSNAPGLDLAGDNSTVRALAIVNSHNVGIVVGGTTGGNTIQSSTITGHAADGIRVSTANNVIGGATAALGNLVSHNGNSGVVLFGTGATGNVIRHNRIGTNPAADDSSANDFDGVQILDGAATNTIDLNVISGNSNSGIYMTSSVVAQTQGNTISGNLIGTDATGAFAVPNGVAGIYLGCSAPLNTFGGTTVATRNVISGNPFGFRILGCGSNSNVIEGNYIGVGADGTTAIANGVGIALEGGAQQTLIGGTTSVAANVIANSTAGGVSIATPAVSTGILHNTIYGNGTVGINLDDLPLSSINDAGDGDSGADNLQNSPVISAAQLNGANLNVTLSIDSTAVTSTQSLVVELFKADAAGQGKTFLGTQCFNGNSISTTMTIASAPVAIGDPIVATATSYATSCAAPSPVFNDGTSPFSASLAVTCTPPVATITAPPSVCANSSGNTASVPFTSGAAYNWTITNGTITNGQGTSSILFSANASGSVALGVTATLGCTASGSASVPIAAATATITASGPTTFCSGGSVDLTANVGNSYQWFKDGNPTGITSQTLTANATGLYSVTVTTGSCSATSPNTSVTVHPNPTPTITGPATVCPNTSFTLDAGSGFASYLWSNGATTQSITITQSSTTTYNVVVTDNNGCSGAASKTVTINPAPSAVITAPSSAAANATGLTASVPSGASSYSWTITNGTITAGQGTPSITFSIGSATATLGVTVSNGTCTATGSKTVSINNLADLAVTITASPDPVAPGGTLTYTVQITNNGPTAAANPVVTDTLPAGVAFVSASGAGWNCFGTSNVQCSAQSSPAGTNSPITIVVTAPQNAGPITNSVSVGSSTPDPKSSNNAASITTNVGAANCPSTPPTLIAPANGATGVLSPVSLQWSAVTNATGYDVFTSVDGAAATLAGSTAGTSLFINLPSGSITWFVVAHVPNCGNLASATAQFTITPGANCGTHAAPVLLAPAQNATVTSPATFSWQPVPEAIGYRVSISLNGAADVDLGTTDGATTLTHDVPSGNITWVVDALFNACPSTRSSRGAFNVPAVDACAGHAAPSLVAPANNSTSASSSIDFQWSAVAGASGYRVWIAVDGTAAAVAGETDATTLHSVISSGVVDWFVEALFDGCASTSSAHFVFTVPKAESCGNAVATLTTPANNSTTSTSIITFAWNGVAGATGYELYASLANGSPVLLGTTNTTTLTKEVGAGTIKWSVRTLFDGCPPRDSQPSTFTFAPPPTCTANQRPLLANPIDGSTVTSPVSFEWSNVGASSYKLFVNAQQLNNPTTQQLPPGPYDWYVEASFNGCPPLRSPVSHFTVVSKPSCAVPAKPSILAPSEVSTGVAYKVRWLPALGADAYVVQEANNAAFANATTLPATIDNKLTFSHPNAGTFFYRVRGISNCSSEPGAFSAVVGVSILPQNGNDGATSPDTPVTLTYSIALDAALAGQNFTATPTEPWLTVTPSSGTVPAGGLTLTVTANTAGLPLGTSLGGVTISTGTPSSSRHSTNGNTTSTTTLTVNVVQPVSPTSKSSPPPDALIIPAVAHADGFNSHFQSDIRLTNTSPQPMKYQLTFTPSGEDGLPNGKQTTIDVDPGRTIALDDVLETWFSSGSTDGSTGTLEIRPLTSTSSKITSNAISGLANLVTFASSRTFNNASNGTYGQYIPAIPFANFIGKGAGTITLQQIAQSVNYRTNLGLVEGSGQPVSLLVSIFGSNGQKIKDFPVDLKGGQHTQLNSFLATQGLNLENARVEVKVATGSGRVTAYASVLDNKTSDPLLVTPTLLTNTGSAKYVLPGVADLGAWHSDVRIFNASSTKVDAQLMFVSQTGAVQTQSLTLGPNEVKELDNLLQSTFGVTNDGGALHISTANASNLIATARTYNASTNGTYGQFISAVTPNDAAALGTRPLQLLQIEESDRYRTNVGIAEVSGKPAKIEVTVVPPDSKVSAVVQLDLAANEFRQLNQVLKSVGMENTYNARVTVQVIDGAGKVTAYASVIDQQTQDPTLLQAQ